MQRLKVELVSALGGDELHGRALHRFRDRLGIAIVIFSPSLAGKWLELLSEIAPGLKRAAIMFNPGTAPVSVHMPSFETAARTLKIEPIIAPVHGDADIETAITALGHEPGGGLVIVPDAFIRRAPRVDHIGGAERLRAEIEIRAAEIGCAARSP
jgi:hypothetical protein